MFWATIWAIFSQAHLVTLVARQTKTRIQFSLNDTFDKKSVHVHANKFLGAFLWPWAP
jgi:hypothetical protein